VANPIAESAPNTVSVFNNIGSFDVRFGAVEAEFATPQSMVSIDASPVLFVELVGTSTNRPFIEFFDSSNILLTPEVLWSLPLPSVGAGPYQTLSFTSSSANIDHVIFSSQHISGQQDVFGRLTI
jgi:hypothetical protein